MNDLTLDFGQGDRLPVIGVQFLNDLDQPLTIPTTAQVSIVFWSIEGEYTVGSAPANVVDADQGIVVYEPLVGDFDVPGQYLATFVVTYESGRTLTVPNTTRLRITVQPVGVPA